MTILKTVPRVPVLALVIAAYAAVGQPPKPVIRTTSGVVNAASYQAPIAPGSWVTIFGSNLAPRTRSWDPATEIIGGILPTSLDGVSVTINRKPAAICYISPDQLNVQAPDDTATGTVQVVVKTKEGGSSDPVNVQLRAAAPALFAFWLEGGPYVAAVHLDGTLVGKPGLIAGAATRAPVPGDIVQLYGTGYGETEPAVAAGTLFTGAAKLKATVTVYIGVRRAEVLFAGLAGAGLYQFNVKVPSVDPGDVAVEVRVGSTSSQNLPKITVAAGPKIQTVQPGTVFPGEECVLELQGTTLESVERIEFEPPDDIEVSGLEATPTKVAARVKVAPTAAQGERPVRVSGPGGTSQKRDSRGPGETRVQFNISTLRISNLRLGTVTNPGSALTIPVAVDYSDPTGAVSSGQLQVREDLVVPGNAGGYMWIGSTASEDPAGRVAGAKSGTMQFTVTFSNLKGTTGANLGIAIIAPDGRVSDTLTIDF